MSVYLYGIARLHDSEAIGELLAKAATSRDLGPAEVVPLGPLSLVFSRVEDAEIRPNRRNLLAHMRVLEALQEVGDVLPVQFGQVFEDTGGVLARIEPRLTAVDLELDRLAGQTEVSLRVQADRDRLIAALAETNPDLKATYAAISSKGPAGHFELIELGRKTAAYLADWRGAAETVLLEALRPLATDHIASAPGEDVEILRADFLIPRTELAKFEAALASALTDVPLVTAEQLEARMIGPAPPSSFVRVTFDDEPAAQLGSAA